MAAELKFTVNDRDAVEGANRDATEAYRVAGDADLASPSAHIHDTDAVTVSGLPIIQHIQFTVSKLGESASWTVAVEAMMGWDFVL